VENENGLPRIKWLVQPGSDCRLSKRINVALEARNIFRLKLHISDLTWVKDILVGRSLGRENSGRDEDDQVARSEIRPVMPEQAAQTRDIPEQRNFGFYNRLKALDKAAQSHLIRWVGKDWFWKTRRARQADSTVINKRLPLPRPLLMSIRFQALSAFVLRHLEASLLLQIAHIMASSFSRKAAKLCTTVGSVKDNRAARLAPFVDLAIRK
jgi:hypothetical protein